MTDYQVGDLVVLKSGSMRMVVEAVEDDALAVVWCHEGQIGRDRFSPALIAKWEVREDRSDRGGDRPDRGERGDRGGPKGPREGGGRSYGGDREGGGKPYRGGERGGERDDRPPRKTGWDGKPREKKYYRKDDA